MNAIEPQSIPDGAASDALNWLTKGDKIELRRGSAVIGTEIPGVGRITGFHVGFKADGTEVWFGTHGMSIYYYDTATELWVEIGTNILGSAADGEDVFFANYSTNAGAQTWFGSPHSSLFKIMTANPGSYTDMYDAARNFKGWIKINQNRMRLWGRKEDKTGYYLSYIDAAAYTTVTAEARHSGNGVLVTFTGTLAFKGGGATRTCFGVTLTDGTETFTDNYNGVLTGSLGGTGTINYTTGAYSITFNTAPIVGVNNITATYQWENSNNTGISDFTKSATRLAGQGAIFRQDDGGGDMKNSHTIGDTDYCFHETRTWALTLTATDTAATNIPYRIRVGIPYLRAALSSSQGIFYIDVTDKSKPLFRRLTLNPSSSEVIPQTVTDNVNLEGYTFDQCAMEEWNDYVLFTGATNDSTVVNRLFLYHKIWKSIDIVDFYPSCLGIGNGTLIAGESISNNFVRLFSGFDDSESLINNIWEGNISELRIPDRLKKEKGLLLEGNIQVNQGYDVYISNDRGEYVAVGSISGSAAYVDRSDSVLVGAYTVGSKEIGGGGDGVEAFHYETELPIRLDKFENRKIKFVATGIGYASISKCVDRDIRLYAKKIARKYRTS